MINNPYKPREIIERNKAMSDYNNLSNDLTIKDSAIKIEGSSKGDKRRELEERLDRLDVKALERLDVDSAAYFDEYDLGDIH